MHPETPPQLPDNHVHTEWSWDARLGSMEKSCRRALKLGLPSIAFTEHADWSRGRDNVVDITAYYECVQRCRAAFPGLRIYSGVELAEPHRHPQGVADLLAAAPLERVLAGVHFLEFDGRWADASAREFRDVRHPEAMFRAYLAEVEALLDSSVEFQVLAHLDYPTRYWRRWKDYDEGEFEEQIRCVLRAAAGRGIALELNTSRGVQLCPGPRVIGWWREEGGRSLSFGSDAHSPRKVAAGFEKAALVAEAAGFRSQAAGSAFWGRDG